jgi:hypothetical protein
MLLTLVSPAAMLLPLGSQRVHPPEQRLLQDAADRNGAALFSHPACIIICCDLPNYAALALFPTPLLRAACCKPGD